MESFFSIPAGMRWPLLAALVLTGIHVYFGIHVLGRKVVFVDLAMAQIAALGAAFGVLMGYEIQHSPWGLYGYSLAFTLLAASVFSVTKMKSEVVPHEAIIGITYAVAVALTMVVLARSPYGPQEFDRMMKGELLYVSPGKVGITAAIYAAVGAVHVVFRKPFFAISFGTGEVRRPALWDFLFYATFGFVVTSSVGIAGVFLVFCLLVIPSVGSCLFSERIGARLAIGWVGGAFLCFVGMKLSYRYGWPTSPVIVVAFAAALSIAGIVRYVWRSPRRLLALARAGAGVGVLALFGSGVWFFRHRPDGEFEVALHDAHDEDEIKRMHAVDVFERHLGRKEEWLPIVRDLLSDSKSANVRVHAMQLLVRIRESSLLQEIARLLRDRETHVREMCLSALHTLEDPRVAREMLLAGRDETIPDLKVQMFHEALELGEADAVDALFDFLRTDPPGKWRRKAYESLELHVDFATKLTPETREACEIWWRENRPPRLVFREHKFRRP